MALTLHERRHPDYVQMQVNGVLRQAGIHPESFHWAVFDEFDPRNWDHVLWIHWIGSEGKHKMAVPSTGEEWTAFISAIKLTI